MRPCPVSLKLFQMRNFFHRIRLALITGYIFLYFGELVFWATPDRPGMGVGVLLITWLVYSIFGYVFLSVVSLFRARNFWAVFLAGAFFGWFEEGIVVQTTYGSTDTPFPMSIAFTALAWHALIDVGVGWYLVRRVLAENRILKTVSLAAAIGTFYGLWAIFWWNEPPEPMQAFFAAGREDLVFLHFAMFALATTGLLILVYWLHHRAMPVVFRPGRIELGFLGAVTCLYFFAITVPAAPRALWLLPLLMGLTLWGLWANRRMESRPDAITAFSEPVQWIHYPALMVIPVVAIAIYGVGLAFDANLRTNLVVYYVGSALGTLCWLAALAVTMVKRPAPQH